MPLGGQDKTRLLAALRRAAPWFRARVGEKAGLRSAPEIRFELDRTFDEADTHRRAAAPARRGARHQGRDVRRGRAAAKQEQDRRLGRARQAAGPGLDPGGRHGCAGCSAPRRRATAARSIRWRPASCRSPWARRPRPSPSSWTAARNTASRCASARRARPRMPKARSPPPATCARPTQAIRAALGRLHRRDRADAAGLLGPQDRRPARLRPGPRGRGGRPQAAPGDDRAAGAARPSRRGPCRFRGWLRQGHLYPVARARPGAGAGHRRIPVGPASDGRRAVPRRGGHFASQTGGPRAYSAASRGPGPRRDRAGRHPGAGPDGGPSGPAAPRPAGALDPGRTALRRAGSRRDTAGKLVALVRSDGAALQPVRVFNL